MTVKKWKHSGTKKHSMSDREIRNGLLSEKAAEEGIVLLKNDKKTLPLNISTKIGLYGAGAGKTVKGGTGSGDVNNRSNISIYQGLKENGIQIVSEKWLANYESIYAEARRAWKEKILEEAKFVENPFDAYAENPFAMPEGRAVTAEDTVDAQTAIYVVSRISGEGKDRRRVEGDYYLSRREREDIRFLDAQKIPTVLILNSGGPVELTDILEETENICAVLNISQLGQRGGLALANVLLGKVTPGGKLTATWARRYEDYPCAEEYSYLNGKLEREEYKEGIYTGYRYFDTFGVKPLFPFGYGLSYTEMQIRFHGMKTSGDGVEVEAEVTNTGETFSGKEVVQVYVSLPQDESGKEYRRLAGFAKTKLLKPGEKELLKIRIDRKTLAYFSEEQHAWIAEKGYYAVWVGNSIASLTLAAMLEVPESVILDKTNILENQTDITEEVYDRQNLSARTLKWKEKAENEKIGRYIYYPEPEKRTECTCQPENKIPAKDLLPLFYGNIAGISSNLGAAGIRVPGSAGETTAALYEQYGVSPLIMADGPAGLRLQQNYEVDRETDTVYGIGVLGSLENGYLRTDETHENADRYYQFCTAFPVGTALAQTWDTALVEKVGIAVAEEMEEFHIDLWLAPGLNIQRNPLCGRNFEYYSEDPLLSGTMAAAMTKGVQSRPGCGVTVKHFACNNQEDNRMGVDAQVSERALREIYLRGFEIAVKESRPVAIMSSYNLLNGVHAANSVDLCTAIARKEWGFDGIVMTDWWAKSNYEGHQAEAPVKAPMVAAQNDIYMVVSDAKSNPENDDVEEMLHAGKITVGELQRNAANILGFLLKSPSVLLLTDRICKEELEAMNTKEEDDVDAGSLVSIESDSVTQKIVIDGALLHPAKGKADVIAVTNEFMGDFTMKFTLKSDLGELAQLPVSVFLDNVHKMTVSVQGTNGKWVEESRILNMEFGHNHYIKFYYGADNLEIKEIVLTPNR